MTIQGTQGGAYPYVSNRAIAAGRRGIQRDLTAIYHQTWGHAAQPSGAAVAPTTAAANNILTTTAGPNATTISPALNGTLVTGGVATLLPLYGPFTGSRNVVVTVTHNTSIVAVSGTITGTDIYGRTIAESWSVTATGTSKTYTSVKCFKTITSLTITSGSDASADNVTLGDGVVFGLDVRASAAVGIAAGVTGLAVKELVDSALVTTGVITPFDPTNSGWSTAFTADPRGTYTPATAPNGTHVYDLWFLSDDPEFSDVLA